MKSKHIVFGVSALLSGFLVGLAGCAPAETPPLAHAIEAAPPTPERLRTYHVTSQALRWGADPDTLLRISRQENFTARRDAWSPTRCCVGVMQINVRAWLGYFDQQCGGSDLLDVRTNACYGVLVYQYHRHVDCAGDAACALRSYYMGPTDGRHDSPAGRAYIERVMSREGL